MTADPYLSDLMRAYGFSIQSVETRSDAAAHWGNSRSGSGFDGTGRRREVSLEVRRELVCEACREPFSYTFEVIAGSIISRGGRSLDSAAMVPALERQLRHRVFCPHCRALQRGARRTFRRRERRHGMVGLLSIGGTAIGTGLLSSGGYLVAGGWGLVIGLGGSALLGLWLTRWMLVRLLEPVAGN